MIKAFYFIAMIFLVSACTTFSYYKAENVTPEGVRVDFGIKDGVHVGDKVNILENKCTVSGRGGNRCRFVLLGTMTLQQVDEKSSLAKLDGDVKLKEGVVFKLEKHCEEDPKGCE